MSWNLIANAEKRLAAETVLLKPAAGGDVRVALGYPNTYSVGMSNLGLQVIYSLLNSLEGVTCERFFLPDPDELEIYASSGRHLFTLESQRPLGDFDIVALTLAYENDYVNLVRILELAGLPIWSRERGEQHPLVLVGGPITLLNPEPVADFVDAFCIGEGEAVISQIVQAWRSVSSVSKGSRPALLEALAAIPGMYIPSMWEPYYTQGQFAGITPSGTALGSMNRLGDSQAKLGAVGAEPASSALPDTPNVISRANLSEEEYCQTLASSTILTEDTELGRSGLVEISRGCCYACRFCTVGFSYPKVRWKPLEMVWAGIEKLLPYTKRIGLISAAVGNYPHIEELCRRLVERNVSVAFSSLRSDMLPQAVIEALVSGGAKSITLAPEVGSDALRRSTNKRFTDAQYLETAERVFRSGIRNIRMYAMVGLPGENQSHLEALVDLVQSTRKLQVACGQAVGHITLSAGQFIPKPATPFQWNAMLDRKTAGQRLKYLEKQVSKTGGVNFAGESPKWALIQGALARGDRRMGQIIAQVCHTPGFSQFVAAFKRAGLELDELCCQMRDPDSVLPWQHLRTSWSNERLLKDWGLAARTLAE